MTSSNPVLDPRIKEALANTYQEMQTRGELLPVERLQLHYSLFRDRFGPERLLALNGEALLNTMHSAGPDSLVYWLEFKNDEEFPSLQFGGISGGSALKYAIYQRKDSGAWMTGIPTRQTQLSTAEAIEIARKHQDQLVAGTRLLEALPPNGSDTDYLNLQKKLKAQAPDLADRAWFHKYLSLLYHGKVHTYHVEDFERFHLVKMLQLPPEEQGRYVAAGRYVALAQELDIPLIHLTQLLNRHNGRPYRVWRVGTRLAQTESIWPMMWDNNCVAIGWPALGDLSHLTHDQPSKDIIRQLLVQHYHPDGGVATRKAQEILNFVTVFGDRDLVLPSHGQRVLAIGRITGAYQYRPEAHPGAPHQRPVQWLSTEEWVTPTREGLQTTVVPMRRYPENLVEVERRRLNAPPPPPPPCIGIGKTGKLTPGRLGGIPGRIQAVLERKGQTILYGPPGTGKTYWARQAALDLASLGAFGRLFRDLDAAQQSEVTGNGSHPGLFRACTFHPSYGYEDFLEGYRPRESREGQLVFERRDGIFKTLCADAMAEPGHRFYLLIDEINRGDIPRIFGELLTLLEKDKRSQAIHLPVSGERFEVPENVYVIGTMNTADRSIALLDTALRRRFGFIELMPEYSELAGAVVGNRLPLDAWLSALNERIRNSIGRDARNRQIGHAYLLDSGRPVTDVDRFRSILHHDILPLLEEYCYEDYVTLERILGKNLIDTERQRFRDELLSSDSGVDLVDAILSSYPEIATSPQATALSDSDVDIQEELDDIQEESMEDDEESP